MSSNDQLFASILLASGLLMSAEHRTQLVAISKGVSSSEAPITITSILPSTPVTTSTASTASVAPPAPKKIKPKSTVIPVPIPMSLLAPTTPSPTEDPLLVPVDMTPVQPTANTTASSTSTTATTTASSTSTTATTTASSTSTTATTTAPSTSTTVSTYPNDALRTHRYRVAVPDPKYCMARRWNEDAPIPGTAKEDAGSNGKIYPEQQCTRFPVEGSGICSLCAKGEAAYLSNPESPPVAAKRWRGRLDGPLFANAPFVGSDLFWKKYPQGLPGDPATAAPADWLAANGSGKSKAKPKAATVTTTTASSTTVVPTVVSSPIVVAKPAITTTVAPVKVVAPKDEWVLALIDDSSYIYERATMKCYEADMTVTTSTKDMARMERYVGRYEPATNTINLYGSESDNE